MNTKVLLVPDAGRDMPEVRLSDHSPFWDAGYDALMLTDTVDTLDLAFFSSVVDGLDEALAAL